MTPPPQTVVWNKLFKFQRDGVIGAIDKLNRFGGCIIADSVGLGKTFEALAIIKYHELRNDRVLVLCPKRLRNNWTLYRANDRRNQTTLAALPKDLGSILTAFSPRSKEQPENTPRRVNWTCSSPRTAFPKARTCRTATG